MLLGMLLKQGVTRGSTGALDLFLPLGEVITQTRSCDTREPPAKRSVTVPTCERIQGPHHRSQYVLGDIGCVGILESPAAEKSVNEGCVQIHELAPSLIVVMVAQSDE
jgi:hypothetical protein